MVKRTLSQHSSTDYKSESVKNLADSEGDSVLRSILFAAPNDSKTRKI